SIDNKQYLLPVSFNLPAVVFSAKNEQSIPDTYMLSLEQIRDTAALFNTVKNDDIYTKMGFAPRWIPEFLYQSLKIMGANFSESSDVFSWDTKAVENTVAFLQDWTKNYNTSTTAEQDYQFKYLYTQELDWISSDRSLFTYTTSSELFHLSSEKLDLLDYRWIHNDTTICIDDAIISMGIYKYSQNIPAAEHFIIWFMNEENQKSLLQAKEELNLYTKTFGIADGFSSIQSVNERVYPIFYKNLFGKLPIADYLQPPNILPGKWESIKERVIIPYIVEAVDTTKDEPTTTMHTLVANWKKQFF
ncbi:MAG TPA: hypothetical protein VFC68_07510, partial [Treponemataceae bacterium]|nr:hypothetical protein [Treponemataceae bacterium]